MTACHTAEELNQHYSNISTDSKYIKPNVKSTAQQLIVYFTEAEVYQSLYHLKKTATGPDDLPYWAIKLGIDFLSGPLTKLINMSISEQVVPSQWKAAIIQPIPKIVSPTNKFDYRPISITSVLSRATERLIIRKFIYPTIINNEAFMDQFAFRPTGSTTAAIIAITTSIVNCLDSDCICRVIAFDFSKAFDTVRHTAVLDRLSDTPLPDNIYNWLSSFLTDREHRTRFNNQISTTAQINCGVVQGSAIGPVAFITATSNLKPICAGNLIYKYADDTYLIVTQKNMANTECEIANIKQWASVNNLLLNTSKSKEIIFTRPRYNGWYPDPINDIPRCDNINILGVTFSSKLKVQQHVNNVISKCSTMFYALKIIRMHGMSKENIYQLFNTLITSRLLYASPSWWGFTNDSEKLQLEAVIRRGKKFGFCHKNTASIAEQAAKTDDKLFAASQSPNHILNSFLPPHQQHEYILRPRKHSLQLPTLTQNNKRGFVNRILF